MVKHILGFEPTSHQVKVRDFFVKLLNERTFCAKPKSIFLRAVAGSGKSSSIMLLILTVLEMEKRTGKKLKCCSVSFNKIISTENKNKIQKIGSDVESLTTNALGRKILAEASKLGKCQYPGNLDDDKYKVLVCDYIEEAKEMDQRKNLFKKDEHEQAAIGAAIKLISAVRLTRSEATEQAMIDIIQHYALDIDMEVYYWNLIVRCVARCIELGAIAYEKGYNSRTANRGRGFRYNPGWHTFDDQICLPLELGLTSEIYDVIFFDEAQDANEARRQLVERIVKRNGILFFVGDEKQAIQGFAFADTNSVQNIIEKMEAEVFTLPISWRCGSDIIRVAQEIVPWIEAAPSAESGEVDIIPAERLVEMVQPGYKRSTGKKDPSVCLFRTNKDAVETCMSILREGKPAIVRGRDIGKSMIALLDKIVKTEEDFLCFTALLNDYAIEEERKLWKKKNPEKRIIAFRDRVETLIVLYERYTEEHEIDAKIPGFKAFINSLFSDDEALNAYNCPIVCSTIHKIKGLEFDEVFIGAPELLPHPMAKVDWQKEQEDNLAYVAVTRAKKKLHFVGAVPKAFANVMRSFKEAVA